LRNNGVKKVPKPPLGRSPQRNKKRGPTKTRKRRGTSCPLKKSPQKPREVRKRPGAKGNPKRMGWLSPKTPIGKLTAF